MKYIVYFVSENCDTVELKIKQTEAVKELCCTIIERTGWDWNIIPNNAEMVIWFAVDSMTRPSLKQYQFLNDKLRSLRREK